MWNIFVQTTNYGLGGLCESHTDPAGIVQHKTKIHSERYYIVGTGDVIATMMAWLNTPKKGGGTGFTYSNREMLIGKITRLAISIHH